VGLHVRAGEHRDSARRGFRLRRIDPANARMRPVGAPDIGVKLARSVDVVGVIAAAAEETQVLLAADGCADALETHQAALPFGARYSAAACDPCLPCISGHAAAIALTM